MGQTRFYRDFQESFMSWFEEQTHKEQVEMLKGIVGKPITKAMLAEYDGSAYDMAEDQDMKAWYEYCIEHQSSDDHKVSNFDLEGAIKEIITEVTDVEWGFAEEFIDMSVTYSNIRLRKISFVTFSMEVVSLGWLVVLFTIMTPVRYILTIWRVLMNISLSWNLKWA